MNAPGRPQLIRSFVIVIAARVVAQLGSLAVVVITARELGVEGRGVMALIVTVLTFAALILGLGLPISGRILLVADDPVPLDHYLGLTAVIVLVSCALIPALVWGFLLIAGADLDPGTVVAVAVLAGLYQSLVLLAAAVAAYGRVVTAGAWEAIGYLLQGVAAAVLLATPSPGVAQFVFAMAVGLLPGVVGLVGALVRTGHRLRPSWNAQSSRRLVTTGWPSLTTLLSERTTFRVDRLILGLLSSARAVGVYSVAATGAEILRFVPIAINQLLFYEITTRRISERQLARLRMIGYGCLAALAFIGALVAPHLIDLLFGPAFASAVTPFRILLLAEFGLAAYLFDATLLNASGLVRRAAVVAMVGLAAILISDLLLIPAFDVTGAAVASVIAYWILALASRRAVRRARMRGQLRQEHPDELEAAGGLTEIEFLDDMQ